MSLVQKLAVFKKSSRIIKWISVFAKTVICKTANNPNAFDGINQLVKIFKICINKVFSLKQIPGRIP